MWARQRSGWAGGRRPAPRLGAARRVEAEEGAQARGGRAQSQEDEGRLGAGGLARVRMRPRGGQGPGAPSLSRFRRAWRRLPARTAGDAHAGAWGSAGGASRNLVRLGTPVRWQQRATQPPGREGARVDGDLPGAAWAGPTRSPAPAARHNWPGPRCPLKTEAPIGSRGPSLRAGHRPRRSCACAEPVCAREAGRATPFASATLLRRVSPDGSPRPPPAAPRGSREVPPGLSPPSPQLLQPVLGGGPPRGSRRRRAVSRSPRPRGGIRASAAQKSGARRPGRVSRFVCRASTRSTQLAGRVRRVTASPARVSAADPRAGAPATPARPPSRARPPAAWGSGSARPGEAALPRP